MPRFLRRNIGLHGVQASSDTNAYALGRAHPHSALGGLIIPQVIEWPWSQDDAGCAFPSGLLGVRSVCAARDTERAWATPGDPVEGEDRWVAVPDTLPAGYTARTDRDHNKGYISDGYFDWDLFTWVDGSTRGTPYFDIQHNGMGWSTTLASDNHQDVIGQGRLMRADYTLNGQSGGLTTGMCPTYRPTGGGGLVPIDWHPFNVSDKCLHAYYLGPVPPLPGTWGDAWWTSGSVSAIGGLELRTASGGPGFRRFRIVVNVFATAANWAAAANADLGFQVRISNSVTGTNPDESTDYTSPLYDKSAFTIGPAFFGGNVYYKDLIIDDTMFTPRDPADGPTFYYIQARVGHKQPPARIGTGPDASAGSTYVATSPQLYLSPRVDVPFWFTATGPGLVAPGGLP